GFSGRIVKLAVRIIFTYEQRPAEKPCFSCLVNLIVSLRTPGTHAITPRIGPHLAPIEISVFLIYRYSIRITIAHHIYFGARLFGPFSKKVTFGNFVTPIRLYVDTQYLPPEVVGIGRRSPGVILFVARTAIRR